MPLHMEAAYVSEKASVSIVLIMLRQQETCWRHHRLKILAIFLLSLVVMQYFFGASVYMLRLFDRKLFGPFIPFETNIATVSPVNLAGNSTVLANVSSEKDSTGQIRNHIRMTGQMDQEVPMCPVVPPVLVGPIRVWFDYPSFEKLKEFYPYLEEGGHGKPKSCLARHRVAIIIPYRDREKHLRGFLHNMHSLLTKQQLDYAIIVVDQIPNQTFNRAKLMNVGFVEALKLYDFQCFVFHDVDLFPEDDRNIYSCPEQPRHMSVAVDKFKYRLPYTDIFGGITALTTDQFRKLNGFSNLYWGWGGEDDDMATRVKVNGYHISRYPSNIAKYRMVKHGRENSNPVNKCRYKLLYKTKSRWKKDGLNSLSYKVEKLDLNNLYTRILVDLREDQAKKELADFGLSC